MTRKTRVQKKSHAWMQAHVDDPWVQRAQREGYRARAAFKLIEIDTRKTLLRPGMTVVDLGAAPGSWSQYAIGRVRPGGQVIALDRLDMPPVAGVRFIQGDFHEAQTLADLRAALAGRAVDVVLSDMAANLTGIAATDQARCAALIELALDFCQRELKPGGDLLVKVFHGSDFAALKRAADALFAQVHIIKPAASRDRSSETYLLARGLREGVSDVLGHGQGRSEITSPT
jgi:23S rRNA (uridine2552-2'-O)-methyltransferase